MKSIFKGALAVAGVALCLGIVPTDASAGGKWGKYEVDGRRSGYTYMTDETRAIQDDELQNPAMLWVDEGETLWTKVDGKAGKSCASCHGDASKSMKGVATIYPKVDEASGQLRNIELQINNCRTQRMGAKAWKYESGPLLTMTVYVRQQSLGMPMNVAVDGKAKAHFERGKKFFYQRRGLLDMSCANCHEDHAGDHIRANVLSEAQTNGFPTYRLKWQKPGSTHRRFKGCNKQVRAQPYGYASPEYLDLELFVAWRGRGLPVERAVRN